MKTILLRLLFALFLFGLFGAPFLGFVFAEIAYTRFQQNGAIWSTGTVVLTAAAILFCIMPMLVYMFTVIWEGREDM